METVVPCRHQLKVFFLHL